MARLCPAGLVWPVTKVRQYGWIDRGSRAGLIHLGQNYALATEHPTTHGACASVSVQADVIVDAGTTDRQGARNPASNREQWLSIRSIPGRSKAPRLRQSRYRTAALGAPL